MPTQKTNREIEVRFLEVDKQEMVKKIQALGAEDMGEELLQETIFYDIGKKWLEQKKMVRLRKTPTQQLLTYKHNQTDLLGGTEEIEMAVDDLTKTKQLLEALGLKAFRVQEKKRHTFKWAGVTISLDEQPMVPVYLEIEGPSEQLLTDAARALGLDWDEGHFESSRDFIEQIYKIPLSNLSSYTFSKVE